MPKAGTVRLAGLRTARKGKLVSQSELSKLSGVAQSTISKLELEYAEAHYRTARRLAEALGVTADEVIGRASAPAPSSGGYVAAGPMTDGAYRPAGRPRHNG